jgi:outer membrane lipoprotein SlyB
MTRRAVGTGIEGQSSVGSAVEIENTQWTKYKNPNGGHGFAAEDANALNDKLRGKKVDKAGLNNDLNGADRIVDGKMIQTKYYNTAQRSVDSAFDKSTGNYKYNGQILEVPKDQYEAALEKMKERIAEGKVPGYTDPEKAGELVKRGDVTYKQALNIAKAGNIDSLWFDVKNQAVVSGCAFGISFVIIYAAGIWNGLPAKKAFVNAFCSALKTGTVVLLSGVGAQQFLRTSLGRSFAAFTTKISRQVVTKIYGTKAGKEIIEKVASAIMKKALHGAAAKSVISKILRSNAVTYTVTSIAVLLPDVYKAIISKRISWTQFSKNFAVALGGIGGGAFGGMAGATAGTFICPGIGTTFGFIVGGVLGGNGISISVKKIVNLITPDDAKIMIESMNKAIEELSSEYMVTEAELEKMIIPQVQSIVDSKWLENMYACSGDRKHVCLQKKYVRDQMECYFKTALKERTRIITPKPDKFKWLAFITKLRLLVACILKSLQHKYNRVLRKHHLTDDFIHKGTERVYAATSN